MNVCIDTYGSQAVRNNHSVYTWQLIEDVATLETISLHLLVDQYLESRRDWPRCRGVTYHSSCGRIAGRVTELMTHLKTEHIHIYHCINNGIGIQSDHVGQIVVSITHDLPVHYPQFCHQVYCENYERGIAVADQKGGHYIATSHVLKDTLVEKYSIGDSRIQVILPTVNPYYRKIAAVASRAYVGTKFGLEQGYLLGVMDAHESHQIIELLEVFKDLQMVMPWTKLVLLLYTSPLYKRYYQQILKTISQLQLGRQVCVITQFTREDQLHFYNDALSLVDASLGNKVNMSLLEAGQCGCPIFCLKTPLHQEILGTYGTYIENIDELIDCRRLIEKVPDKKTVLDTVATREQYLKQLQEVYEQA